MTPLRIAYVCADRGVPVLGHSGSSTHICEFVRALQRRGHQVTVLAATPSDGPSVDGGPCPIVDLSVDPLLRALRMQTAKALREAGSETTRAGEIYSLLINQTLIEKLQALEGRIDLVYERQSLWSYAALQFAHRAGLPFVLEVNAPLSLQQEEYRQLDMRETATAIESLVLSQADQVVVTTAALRDYARSHGASRRRIRVLPCGVAAQMFPESGRTGTRGAKDFVLGFVGSLKPWHGVEILLEAFLQLSYRSGAYRLLVVGDGPLRSSAEDFCRQHNLARLVTFTGGLDQAGVAACMARIDVGLAPYPPLPLFYFSPMKIWEYAAAGVPIVASASGDLPVLFPHKGAALLHPPGNIGKIVKHVERLRKEPDLANKVARRARRVAQRHTWDALAARFKSMAQRLVRTPAPAKEGDS